MLSTSCGVVMHGSDGILGAHAVRRVVMLIFYAFVLILSWLLYCMDGLQYVKRCIKSWISVYIALV